MSSIISDLNPFRWNLVSASVPPATTMLAMPAFIMLHPKIIALSADEQAVDGVMVRLNTPK